MDSSAGILFELLRVISFLVLFLISCVNADHSPAFQGPSFCFFSRDVCLLNVAYPAYPNGNSCGYPGLRVDCNSQSGQRPFMNISHHIYHVLRINYESKTIILIDEDGEASSGGCPQPKRNFSFPSSPSYVNYKLSANSNITIFYNCSSVPSYAEQHLLCLKEDYKTTNTLPSYAFYNGETRAGFDWYGNCAENVVVPVFYDMFNYSDAIKAGIFMEWSATDWCKDCERSGGQCWSNSTATGCACATFGKSYNRTCPQGLKIGLKIGIGVLSGTGGLLLLALIVYFKWFNHSSISISPWRNKNKSPVNIEVFLEKYGCLALQRYKYSEIKKMTNSFKDTLGQGGYGRVFKGELHDGRLVAVKQLNESKGDGEDFINEVATIGRTNHVNVVNLVGFCIEGTRKSLVYEFMPNGSLERFIYSQKESSTTLPLGWEKLYQIALGIARGLEYLHRGCNTRILHFDIKPHNILLDENFCPKISDFGLAKLCPSRESVVSTVGTRGTMGYIAPELCYKSFGNVSHKSDVYSYGMMMLEMIGGRKNIDATVDNISEIYFPLWIYNHLKRSYEAKGLEEIQAREVFEDEKAKKMILVALWCIQAHPVDRPSMSKVVEMLEGNIHELQMPPNPSVDPRSSSSNSS